MSAHPHDGPVEDDSALRDPQRLSALEATRLMGTQPELVFDELAQAALEATGAQVALLSLVDDRRSFFKSFVRADGASPASREVEIQSSLCRELVCRDEAFVAPDTVSDPRARDYEAVTKFPVGAYLGFPVRAETGEVLGSFCVVDPEARDFSDEQAQALARLATLAEQELRRRIAGA